MSATNPKGFGIFHTSTHCDEEMAQYSSRNASYSYSPAPASKSYNVNASHNDSWIPVLVSSAADWPSASPPMVWMGSATPERATSPSIMQTSSYLSPAMMSPDAQEATYLGGRIELDKLPNRGGLQNYDDWQKLRVAGEEGGAIRKRTPVKGSPTRRSPAQSPPLSVPAYSATAQGGVVQQVDNGESREWLNASGGMDVDRMREAGMSFAEIREYGERCRLDEIKRLEEEEASTARRKMLCIARSEDEIRAVAGLSKSSYPCIPKTRWELPAAPPLPVVDFEEDLGRGWVIVEELRAGAGGITMSRAMKRMHPDNDHFSREAFC